MNSKQFTAMCSEHITFVRIVDRPNLINVGRIWSSQCSHTVCLTSTDHPHEAPNLIGSSWVLAHCRALSTADADRTPLIDVYQLFGYFRSSAKMVERLMKFSLKFGGLTILVAHLLTSRTLGQNPRVLTEETCAHSVSFFSHLFFFFLMQESFLMLPFSLGSD